MIVKLENKCKYQLLLVKVLISWIPFYLHHFCMLCKTLFKLGPAYILAYLVISFTQLTLLLTFHQLHINDQFFPDSGPCLNLILPIPSSLFRCHKLSYVAKRPCNDSVGMINDLNRKQITLLKLFCLGYTHQCSDLRLSMPITLPVQNYMKPLLGISLVIQ